MKMFYENLCRANDIILTRAHELLINRANELIIAYIMSCGRVNFVEERV
jgi:hypothetical protein